MSNNRASDFLSFPLHESRFWSGHGILTSLQTLLALVIAMASPGCGWFDSGPVNPDGGDDDGELVDGGEWDTGPCIPTGPEICDGIDNDCDGLTDEDFNLDSNPASCGECGVTCSSFHNEGTCAAGACVMGCEFGWVDANGNPYDGCEYECTPESRMELVGTSCDDGIDNDCDGRTDGTDPDCASCVPEFCNSEDDDCDGLVDEDYDLRWDDANCGRCGHACPPRPNARGDCAMGVCEMTCEAGWSDLNGLEGDGCEEPCVPGPDTSEAACNGVDNDCDGQLDEDYLPTQCGSGPCVVDSMCSHGEEICTPTEPPMPSDTVCNGVDDDCDGLTDEDGNCTCETSADCNDDNPCTSDTCLPDNRCMVTPAPDGTTCPAGECCSSECTDTQTSSTDCGECGNTCGADSRCTGGICTCTGSLLNCNESWADGCEADTATDPDNCGTCDNRCGLNASCVAATCTCDSGYVDCNLIQADGCEILESECNADCGWPDGQDLAGADMVVGSGQILSGRYKRINIFRVPAGVIGLVARYDGTSGGTLEVCARQIIIEGSLSAVAAGYAGGCSGDGASCTGAGAPGSAGGGTYGGAASTGGGSCNRCNASAGGAGGNGGYAAAGSNGDTSTDESLLMGSGGGGGGGGGGSYGPNCLSYGVSSGGGGGGGGNGGGAIKLYASISIQVSGSITSDGNHGGNGTNGRAANPTSNCTNPCTLGGAGGDPDTAQASSGGAGGSAATAVGAGASGGNGGGGAGGGILLRSPSVSITGTLSSVGAGSSVARGGTIKIFYQSIDFSGTTQHGRLYQTTY